MGGITTLPGFSPPHLSINHTATKTEPSTHPEDLVHSKDEFDQHVSCVDLPKTTLYQVIFSMLIGLSGWMYNFDLGE